MPLILHIDTAVAGASICLSRGDTVLAFAENESIREGAAWLQVAIRDLFAAQKIDLKSLDAISVSSGPGSYTGLRVGMASAKGLCYALRIPLIAIPTLQAMAAAAGPAEDLLCPMIDARRMEVFSALYNQQLQEHAPARNYLLDENSFGEELEQGIVSFFGNGAEKFAAIQNHLNARFLSVTCSARNSVPLALTAFQQKKFADLAYEEPLYGKEFYTPVPPMQG